MFDKEMSTNKALAYLHARGAVSAPSVGYSFLVGGASDKMVQHVRKVYPLAEVQFVTRNAVVLARLEQDIAFSLAVLGRDQSPAASMAAAILNK